MVITDKELDAFRRDFAETVKGLQEKYDVTISLGSITYNDDRFSARITVNNGQDPEIIARKNFDTDVWKYEHLGLSQGMYKRVFTGMDEMKYALLGFNTKAKKYPIIAVRISDGEEIRGGERFIKELHNEYYAENLANEEEP